MSERHLHIISFSIPYPPNYGGVIDVFYKLKALHAQGIKIHLHCYEYDRERSPELLKYCDSVQYYKRRTGILSALSFKPYIVSSRRSRELLNNLLNDDYPVLFEGLHTCYHLGDKRLRERKKIYRESNIEHHYYYNLYRVEKNLLRKMYFLLASVKLKWYERILRHASLMLVVSEKDADYLRRRFRNTVVHFLPSFHANDTLRCKTGHGDYALYHGNLSIAENYNAASYLIKEVFNDSDLRLVIAGLNPPEHLKAIAEEKPNVTITCNPSDDEMFRLIENAQVNVLVTFQATGLKLKLLNTLYNGRFVVVNKAMLNGTGLDDLCVIADSSTEIKKDVRELCMKDFMEEQVAIRAERLQKNFCNESNARRLIDYIF
jgi:hypothetical protein